MLVPEYQGMRTVLLQDGQRHALHSALSNAHAYDQSSSYRTTKRVMLAIDSFATGKPGLDLAQS
jgi:RNA:NAD 2'-phosphotransferase (TPT1/KptA family)